MNTRNHFKLRFLRAALMLTLAVMTFPIEAWAEKIPYAVLSDEGKTLTFKYEEHTVSGENEWDVSNTAGELGIDDPEWFGHFNSITTVVFDESFAGARPKSCYYWFYHFSWLTTITGLNYLNTSEVTNMENMFNDCSSLTSLDLSSFNTSKVTNMSGMFRDCSDLTSLAIGSGFTVHEYGDGNIEGKTKTDKMFYGCNALADGMLIVNGIGSAGDNNLKPSIAQNIFEGVFTNGTLATNLTAEQLGASEPDGDGLYTWKGGKFKSVGKVKIPYIDENGKLHYDDGTNTPTDPSDDCAEALPITSANGNVSYGAGWYFVTGDVNINGQLKFTGNANLILCDGAKMTVTNTNNHAIYREEASLAIYGQSTGNGMGSLTATASGNFSGIYAFSVEGGNSSITINGGKVTGTGGTYGFGICTYSPMEGNSSVTINGGHVTATAGTNGSGIRAYSSMGGNSSIIINGGHVTATSGTNGCGIEAYSTEGDANITLGWTKADDYICANSYILSGRTAENMNIAAGKRFVAYNMASDDDISANCIIGDASSNTATAIDTDISLTDATAAKTIAGKTLRPLNGYTVSTTDGNIILKDGSTAKTADFTITNGTGSNAVTTSYYIYKASTTEAPVSVTLGFSGEVPTGYAPVYTATKTIDGTDVTSTVISGSTLTMPAYDVTITAETGIPVATVTVGSGTSAVTEAFVSGIHAPDGVTKNDAAALQAAVNYAQSLYVTAQGDKPATVATVTLSKDVSFDSNIDSEDDLPALSIGDGSSATAVKLDLNGKKLSSTVVALCVVAVEAYAELTIIGNGTICNSADRSLAINNIGTLNVSGGNISGIDCAISNSRMLTVSGGTISATGEEGYGIVNIGTATITGGTISATATNSYGIHNIGTGTLNVSGGTISGKEYGIYNDGTLTLHAINVFGNSGADIWLGTGKKIGFGSGTYSIPEKKIKVVSYGDNALPYTFTSGYSTYVKSGNDIIDPDDVFDNSAKIILFGGEAQLMDANAIYVKYIDANGKLHDDLDGSTETTDDDGAAALPITSANSDVEYAGGWYFVTGDVTINGQLKFTGNMDLILCDGAKMTVTKENHHAIDNNNDNNNLTIYSQSIGTAMGQAIITSSTLHAFYFNGGNFTINGGDITANGGNTGEHITFGICAHTTINNGIVLAKGKDSGISGDVYINGGKVTAKGLGDNVYCYGIKGSDKVVISGGQVEASGKGYDIYTFDGEIILGWTKPDDYIKAKKYINVNDNTIKIVDGKVFQYDNAGKKLYEGSYYHGDINALDIDVLTPYGLGGYCGKNESKNVTWGIPLADNPETDDIEYGNTLYIEGTGDMADYTSADTPWKNHDDNVSLILVPTEAAYTNAKLNATDKAKLAPSVITLPKNAGGWNTYCHNYPVAYSLSDGNTGDDAPKAYTVSGLSGDGTCVQTTAVTSNLVAPATPLLLGYTIADDDNTTPDENVILTAEPTTAATVTTTTDNIVSTQGTGITFWGALADKAFSANDMDGKQYYVLSAGKQFVRVNEAGTIAAHKCWIELPNSTTARQLNIVIGDGDTTAVANSSLFTLHSSLSEWYSLDGRKLEGKPTKKGVYINGGRKVVIK